MPEKAGILAIGSELLAGQIANTNAAWISQKLLDLGLQVVRHLTVDDVQEDIITALDQLAQVSGVIVLTGGLGPTSDDLTRQAVATWASVNLEYHSESWSHIVKIFKNFEKLPPESNRQQCWFPEGSKVLMNRTGTANAFVLECRDILLIVLPGPPHEVAAVWNDHLIPFLESKVPKEKRPILKMWRTIGKGESHLAELVRPLLEGQKLDVAYRAHAPYVELKIRCPWHMSSLVFALERQLDQILGPWLYEKDDENYAAELLTILRKQKSFEIYDGATQGHLSELLAPLIRDQGSEPQAIAFNTSWENHDSPEDYVRQICEHVDGQALSLIVVGFDQAGEWALGVRYQDEISINSYPSPYKGSQLRSRNLKAISYLAVKEWVQILARLHH